MSRFWLKWSVYMPMPASVAAKGSRTRETTAACRLEPKVEPLWLHNLALQNVAARAHRFRPLSNASRSRPTRELHGCFVPLRLTLILWAIGPSLAPAHPPHPSRAGANAVSTEVRILCCRFRVGTEHAETPRPAKRRRAGDRRHRRVGLHAQSHMQGRSGIRHSVGRKVAVNANIAAALQSGDGGRRCEPSEQQALRTCRA